MGNINLTARAKRKSGVECLLAVTFHLRPVFSRHKGWTLRRCCICCCCPHEPCPHLVLWKPHRLHPNEGWHCCWRSHNSGPDPGQWHWPWPGIRHAHKHTRRGKVSVGMLRDQYLTAEITLYNILPTKNRNYIDGLMSNKLKNEFISECIGWVQESLTDSSLSLVNRLWLE